MLGVVTPPVVPLGVPPGASAPWVNDTLAYDVAIGGLPFLLAPDPQFPYERQTAQYERQQIDTTKEPGEHSLTGSWLRSQSSFHMGAGLKYLDPVLAGDSAVNRFESSYGVDVWTPGQVTLLRDTEQLEVATTSELAGWWARPSDPGYAVILDGDLCLVDPAGVTPPATVEANVTCAVAVGSTVYYATSTEVRKAPGSGPTAAVATVPGIQRLAWTKERLVGVDNAGKVFELTGATPSTAIYTHPLGGDWTWTAIAETSSAVWIAGYAGDVSTVFQVTLDVSGTPKLNVPIPALNLPRGEVVHSLASFTGTHLAVGTNRGVRLGVPNYYTDMNLGPLVLETDGVPVLSMDVYDRFLYAAGTGAVNGASGLWRLDLGPVAEDNPWAPYASDVAVTDGSLGDVTSVAWCDGELLFTVVDSGLWRQHATRLVEQGALRTSLTRFNTTDPKAFHTLRLTFTTAPGNAGVARSSDGVTFTHLYTTAGSDGLDVSLSLNAKPAMQAAFRVTLYRDPGDDTAGTVLSSYQLRALPAGERGRVIQLPLMVFAEEKDRKGQRIPGSAWDRISALEDLERSGAVVLYQDFITGEAVRVQIAALQFTTTNRPGEPDGFGGRLLATLRTATA